MTPMYLFDRRRFLFVGLLLALVVLASLAVTVLATIGGGGGDSWLTPVLAGIVKPYAWMWG